MCVYMCALHDHSSKHAVKDQQQSSLYCAGHTAASRGSTQVGSYPQGVPRTVCFKSGKYYQLVLGRRSRLHWLIRVLPKFDFPTRNVPDEAGLSDHNN